MLKNLINMAKKHRKFIDIGANLSDLMYSGIYNGSNKHPPDLEHVLKRSWECGLDKIIITGGSLEESKKALEIAQNDERLFSTVGWHPTRCSEFNENPDSHLQNLQALIQEGGRKIVAIGEIGLDYDRLEFCPKEVQLKSFELQMKLLELFPLPLFLHCRNAAEDLHKVLSKIPNVKGVVHSFDGSLEEATRFIEMGLYIGINGCSLKTKDNLNVVAKISKEHILIETDCPWCEIRPSHAGYTLIKPDSFYSKVMKKEKWTADAMVKNRNEPSSIRQILDICASIKSENPDDLCETFYNNTVKLFGF